MTIAPEQRRLLPLAPHARGKRSAVTCALKCGDQCAHPVPNTSSNEYFRDVASAAFTRRRMLGGVGGGALALALAPAAPAAAGSGHGSGRGLRFDPIAPVPADVDTVTVPKGWTWTPVIRWGDPLFADSPEFDPSAQTEASQRAQFGYNCDYLDVIPTDGRRGRRALAVVNHEYTNENLMFPPDTDEETVKKVAMAAHGLSVVELRRKAPGTPWEYVRGSRHNRRIHSHTRFAVDGPAAGHPLLRTQDDPVGRTVLGTFNNCSGGTTPWGTVLSGEENFNQYFVANPTPENARYGISSTEGGRAWWTVDPRFDARRPGYENEVNRFGWVVEIDPDDPHSTPVKHTAMGRFKHESANIRVARDGRVVAYSGDDERFDYIYKFVSSRRMVRGSSRWAKAHNKRLLSDGDLYVARLTGDSPAAEIDGTGTVPSDGAFDGSGRWLPLVENGRSKVPGMSVAEVLVHTRLAADKVGPTKMDRPEDIQPNPVTGKVYAALTNNTNRGVGSNPPADEANPRTTNREGHVLEITEYRNDPTSTRFAWTLLLVCGDPDSAGTYFGGYDGPVSPISCPDNVAFDSTGALWISTDGQPGTLGLDDALHRVTLSGRERGKVEQFLAVPTEAETCGPVIHDQDGMVFVCVQHPGEDGSWEDQHSYFPDYAEPGSLRDGDWGGPRPSVVQVHRA
ncbi:PhoX family phosphatase [Phycicoccus sp. CSK15P-2]|uniref:PhoX family protein n=1 Tax=Phycicoccus sp. CSK15P-2 TaxID=2807627 RepID=UPI00194DECA5|nr:PhoX family phosphatase [Phycicoccus sp. CSK15P-2]MBM6404910.1 PhoX family phosphatase [Phycicoccus sp. CSK15P-2]